jgi:hypothetical protein
VGQRSDPAISAVERRLAKRREQKAILDRAIELDEQSLAQMQAARAELGQLTIKVKSAPAA